MRDTTCKKGWRQRYNCRTRSTSPLSNQRYHHYRIVTIPRLLERLYVLPLNMGMNLPRLNMLLFFNARVVLILLQNTPSISASPPPAPPSSPFSPDQEIVHRNLGENGTGIRRNYTLPTTTPKPVVSTTMGIKMATDSGTVARNNQTGGDDTEIAITKFTDVFENFNKTLKEHNITESQNDTHMYYNSTFKIDPAYAMQYWVDMDNRSDVKVNELLSRSHRRAAVS